jgi:hypothetical protein
MLPYHLHTLLSDVCLADGKCPCELLHVSNRTCSGALFFIPAAAGTELYRMSPNKYAPSAHSACSVNNSMVLIRDIYAGASVMRPYYVAGKWQQDPRTGALLNLTLPTVTVEFDSSSRYDWGMGSSRAVGGSINASANLLTNCWGALTTKNAWLGKKYHISGCSAQLPAS